MWTADWLWCGGARPLRSSVELSDELSELLADELFDELSDELSLSRFLASPPKLLRVGGLLARRPRSAGSEIVRSRMRWADFVLATREAPVPTPRTGCAWNLLFEP
jgi:hypothetical protein